MRKAYVATYNAGLDAWGVEVDTTVIAGGRRFKGTTIVYFRNYTMIDCDCDKRERYLVSGKVEYSDGEGFWFRMYGEPSHIIGEMQMV